MKIKIFCCHSMFPSWLGWGLISTPVLYRGADKSLPRPTFRCTFFWWWEYFVWC